MPTFCATKPVSRWSMEPSEPPEIEVPPGLSFQRLTKSSSVLNSDLAGTTNTAKSSASRAMGTMSSKVDSESESSMAPTMTPPVTISMSWRPCIWTNWLKPMVPPAPGTLTTCALFTTPPDFRACCDSRANPSQPPPGAAGAMRTSFERAVASPPLAAALTSARPATTATTVPYRVFLIMLLLIFIRNLMGGGPGVIGGSLDHKGAREVI